MSDFLVWSEEYGIDGGIIDAQHKQLFRLVGRLLEIDDTSRQTDDLKSIIMQLFQFMEFHFQREEKLAEDSGYPKIEILKKAHREIIDKMNEMMASCANYREL
jgi:hemerythrin